MSFSHHLALLLAPASAFGAHATIQQLVGASPIGSTKPSHNSFLAAFKRIDMERAFGPKGASQFYLALEDKFALVQLRLDRTDPGDIYGVVIPLTGSSINLARTELTAYISGAPVLRYTIVSEESDAAKTEMAVWYKNAVTATLYAQSHMKKKFTNGQLANGKLTSGKWEINADPVPIETPRLHLKDIPLTTRAERRLLRGMLETHKEVLDQAWNRFNIDHPDEENITFNFWLEYKQGVKVTVLEDLATLDNLPDEEYVQAMSTFKKAQVQALHSQAVKDKTTELHLFDWTLEHFEQEFNALGIAEAQRELDDVVQPEDEEEDGLITEQATFVVGFDGVIVEDQGPSIGPVSPYAIEALKLLVGRGHRIVIFSERVEIGADTEEATIMLDFLKNEGLEVFAAVSSIGSGDQLFEHSNDLTLINPGEDDDVEEGITFDYLIDARQLGIATAQLSPNAPATVYWADLVSTLIGLGYLTVEDQELLVASLTTED